MADSGLPSARDYTDRHNRAAANTKGVTQVAIAHDTGVRVHDKLFIGGEWVEPVGEGTLDVIDAGTEAVIGTIPDGNEDDVDRAVRAAVEAFDGWSATPPRERAA